MRAKDFDGFFKEIDSSTFKYDHEYVDLVLGKLNSNKEQLSPSQQDFLKLEAEAFMVHTVDTLENPKEPRFRNTENFSDESLEHYSSRIKKTQNSLVKQRFADILWEFGSRDLNKGQVGDLLVRSSIEASQLLASLDNEFERTDSANRALQVAKFLEKKPGELTELAKNNFITLVEFYVSNDQIRYTLELLKAAARLPKMFNESELKRLSEVAGLGISHFKDENDNFTLRGHFVELKSDLDRLVDPTSFDPKEAAIRKAQPLIEESERRTDSPMVQQHFLVEAEKILKDAGLNEEAHKLRLKVEAIGKSEGYDKQFKEFTFESPFPTEQIELLKSLINKYDDKSAVIAVSPNFFPSWSGCVDAASEDKQTHIADIFTTSTVDENGMVIAIEQDDARKRTLRYYQPEVELKLSVLKGLLRELIKEGKIDEQSFHIQFDKLQHIDSNMAASVQMGIELYVKGGENTYPASLILTTQLENFMWKLLPLMESEQYIFERDGRTQSPKTMGWFLPEMKDFINEDLYELAFYTLIDKGHLNLRNLVGHGKTHRNLDNELICVRIIQLFAGLLVGVNLEQKVETDTSDSKGTGE